MQAVQAGLSCPPPPPPEQKKKGKIIYGYFVVFFFYQHCKIICSLSLTLSEKIMIPLVAGMGGKLSRAVNLTPTWILKVIFHAYPICFKLSEYKFITIIIIIQIKLSCFLCHLVSYPWLQEWGQAVQGGLSCPHPPPPPIGYWKLFYLIIPLVLNYLYMNCIIYNHNSDQIELFSLSFGLIP